MSIVSRTVEVVRDCIWVTESALSGGRFCQYTYRDEERRLRRGGRRIAPGQRVGGFFRFFKSVHIYTQIGIFREHSNLLLTHSKHFVCTKCLSSMSNKPVVAVFTDQTQIK